jgi:hypothetical protein
LEWLDARYILEKVLAMIAALEMPIQEVVLVLGANRIGSVD